MLDERRLTAFLCREEPALGLKNLTGKLFASIRAFLANLEVVENELIPTVAAHAELRRRHSDQRIEPLRSAKPTSVSDTARDELALTPDKKIAAMAAWVHDLGAERQTSREKRKELQGLKVPA